jgi:hypothetical protein
MNDRGLYEIFSYHEAAHHIQRNHHSVLQGYLGIPLLSNHTWIVCTHAGIGSDKAYKTLELDLGTLYGNEIQNDP